MISVVIDLDRMIRKIGQNDDDSRTVAVFTVTSMLMISPSARGRSSGMPWHTTLLTDVQTDFGNAAYRNGDGYAFALIVSLWTNRSISSVVMPTFESKKKKNVLLYYLSDLWKSQPILPAPVCHNYSEYSPQFCNFRAFSRFVSSVWSHCCLLILMVARIGSNRMVFLYFRAREALGWHCLASQSRKCRCHVCKPNAAMRRVRFTVTTSSTYRENRLGCISCRAILLLPIHDEIRPIILRAISPESK